MATVYLAHDLRHERKVALKVLKPELAAVVGAERFLAEIKTTANLTHPHILPLFDSGEADSFLFYVMPHVEGESLRGRLGREHQLPVDDAVRIATNLAEALDYAHRQGVIHRDIKPPNVLLLDGKPVLSDFGIALAVSAGGGSRLTETGLSLGTPHYMSPEQATGDLNVGPATDIYALGCVLYEMLVGEPPHTGSTAQAILGKIIAGTPESVTAQRKSVPTNVDAAIHRALEKLPADRFLRASDFAAALADPGFASTQAVELGATRPPLAGRLLWPAVTLASLGIAAWSWTRPEPPRTVVRSQVYLPEGQRVFVWNGLSRPLDISRDGTGVVYLGEQDGAPQLFLRQLGDYTARALPGTEDARQPFFSHDGQQVGFFVGNELRRISLTGGAPITVTRLPTTLTAGASWGADDTILVSAGPSLYQVDAVGGDAAEVSLSGPIEDIARGADSTANPLGEPRWPQHLPGGTHALVTVSGGTSLLELESGVMSYLFSGVQARYVPSGHLVYHAGQERVRTVPFDLDRFRITGSEASAVEDVFRGPGSGAAAFAISQTGTLVYMAGGTERSLWLVDREGRETRVPVPSRGYRFPRFSPDGSRIAVVVDPRPSQVWVVDLDRTGATPVTRDGHHVTPEWAPDGKALAFALEEEVYWMPWPEGGNPRPVTNRPLTQYEPSWTLGGRILAEETGPADGKDLVSLDLASGTSTEFLATPANEWLGTFSPGGEWVAFVSDLSGRGEIYTLPSSGDGPPRLVSDGGGTDPRWSTDGTEIFYRIGDRIWAVDVQTTPTFSAGRPREILAAAEYDFSQDLNWDIGADGRFVMIKSDPYSRRRLQVVTNWFEELTSPGN